MTKTKTRPTAEELEAQIAALEGEHAAEKAKIATAAEERDRIRDAHKLGRRLGPGTVLGDPERQALNEQTEGAGNVAYGEAVKEQDRLIGEANRRLRDIRAAIACSQSDLRDMRNRAAIDAAARAGAAPAGDIDELAAAHRRLVDEAETAATELQAALEVGDGDAAVGLRRLVDDLKIRVAAARTAELRARMVHAEGEVAAAARALLATNDDVEVATFRFKIAEEAMRDATNRQLQARARQMTLKDQARRLAATAKVGE
jgi:hypothetical protein